jgi:hypothetical protein
MGPVSGNSMHESLLKHLQLRGNECFVILFDEFQAFNDCSGIQAGWSWYCVAVTDNIMVIYRNMNDIIMIADSVPSISSFEYPSTGLP